ncbi:hypothetical protein Pan241w_25320 [Gimesia alba]|uniref:3-keto-alpha-glucoside-1,2-lyase/3-keto-2-hydroxy-glucal hydratase domain-containing protein n=1 Tax=Gimesia alba TaxID=2527973 RepID=A0A517RF04_9PLAN|nr:DUF1080 domain-containing protein [Gimesia alba]QDT42448.1 hypothetical protein Pan241w_25320 [Gimesia alba]
MPRKTVNYIVLSALFLTSCQKVEHPSPPAKSNAEPQAKEVVTAKTNPKTTAEPAGEIIPETGLTDEEIAAGWIALFDGHSLFGWKANNDVNWHVEQGVIKADSGKPGLLLTTSPFADYELKFDFRLTPETNSGLFLRTFFDPKDPGKDCYELNLCDQKTEYPTGSLVGRSKIQDPVPASQEWQSFVVRLEGPKIQASLNGKEVLNFTDTSKNLRKVGFIGLQKNEGPIEFRKIYLKPLRMSTIFNGVDLAGWRVVPGSKSKFEVVDSTIHVTAEKQGYLETEETWDNFLFQATAKSNGTALNSGYFFRAIKGSEKGMANGYEVQIHNGIKDKDRTKPENAGTGAIFRRTEARRVVSNDNEWFTTTLSAYGSHIAVWIDGYQVTDWNDTRKPDENPRKGLRLKAGHISLQGHDPTTDLNFKDLKVSTLPVESP